MVQEHVSGNEYRVVWNLSDASGLEAVVFIQFILTR